MILARSCKIVATSLAVSKIFEGNMQDFLQDVSEFAASLPARFLQEVYVWACMQLSSRQAKLTRPFSLVKELSGPRDYSYI